MERKPNIDLPVYVERELRLNAPELTLPVRLPYIKETLWWENTQYLSMHTDMMGCLCRTIWSLKKDVRENLFIQARALTKNQWKELSDHPVFEFFFEGRAYRRDFDNRKQTATYLVPKGLRLTEKRISEYFKLDFNPKTLSSEIGFKVGWFRAEWLARKEEDEWDFNSLGPFLGAVNQFRIGSDNLTAATMKKVAIQFAREFESGVASVEKSILDDLSWEKIEAASDVLRIDCR